MLHETPTLRAAPFYHHDTQTQHTRVATRNNRVYSHGTWQQRCSKTIESVSHRDSCWFLLFKTKWKINFGYLCARDTKRIYFFDFFSFSWVTPPTFFMTTTCLFVLCVLSTKKKVVVSVRCVVSFGNVICFMCRKVFAMRLWSRLMYCHAAIITRETVNKVSETSVTCKTYTERVLSAVSPPWSKRLESALEMF